MKIPLLILLILYPFCSHAKEMQIINTDVFTIEVPDSWNVFDEDKRMFMGGYSKESYDGWPVEMIMIDYCLVDGPKKEPNTIQCTECTEDVFKNIITQSRRSNAKLKIRKTNKNDLREYRVGEISKDGGKIMLLQCNKKGQTYLELMTSKPSEQFFSILPSLKLK